MLGKPQICGGRGIQVLRSVISKGLLMMQEVLSKAIDANVPLQEQEYYQLQLDDLGSPFQPQFIDSLGIIARHRFIVREAHAAWSEIDLNVMWDTPSHDECSTLREAKLRYEVRRAAIVKMGFIYSDMEF